MSEIIPRELDSENIIPRKEEPNLEVNPEVNPRVYAKIFGIVTLDEYVRKMINGDWSEQA